MVVFFIMDNIYPPKVINQNGWIDFILFLKDYNSYYLIYVIEVFSKKYL